MASFKTLRGATKAFVRPLLILFVSLVTGCASAGGDQMHMGEEVPYEATTFSFDRKNTPYDMLPEYRIMPGDILDVLFQTRTWEKKDNFRLGIDNAISVRFVHAPELNVEEKVRPDGNMSLPYIGNYYVLGKSVEALTAELKEYYGKILQNPDLYILVPDYRSAIKDLKTDLHTAPRGLSRLVTVRPDGYTTFPLIGHIMVAGRTFSDVNKQLNEQYEGVMAGLHCDLFLEKHNGSKLYVLGDVIRPGVYEIPKPITIEQAVAMAGGFSHGAKLDTIIIIRKKGDKMIATRFDFTRAFREKEAYSFFYLSPDDMVYVPKRPITRIAELMRDVGDALHFRGWSVGLSWELHSESDNQVR